MDSKSRNITIAGILAVILVVGGVILFTGGDDEQEVVVDNSTSQTEEVSTSEAEDLQTIVELAQATPDLSTLVSAVVAADLVETLNGEGPFTVFAPTNDAFTALPDGTLDTLLDPANIEDLQNILTYHVVAGEAMSSDLQDGKKIKTVQGQEITVSINDGKVTLNGSANVVTADVKASNGVVHIIDAVLLPQ